MPTNLPSRPGSEIHTPHAQATLLSDALATDDAFLVSRALHDIAHKQGQSYSFGDDPALSVVLAALRAMNLELVARSAVP